MVLRKAHRADGAEVFYKAYQDSAPVDSGKLDFPIPCTLNSQERLYCLIMKAGPGRPVSLYKINGVEGSPQAAKLLVRTSS